MGLLGPEPDTQKEEGRRPPECHDRGVGGSHKTECHIVAIAGNDFERRVATYDCLLWGSGACLGEEGSGLWGSA